jgi:hypothetical protein
MDKKTEDLFWSRVFKTDTCWLWCGALGREGYGLFSNKKQHLRAHRIAYSLIKGPIAPGMVIDHLCRVRNCVNPDHLDQTDNVSNSSRQIRLLRSTCRYGHPYTKETTGYKKSGARVCKVCAMIMRRKSEEAKGRRPRKYQPGAMWKVPDRGAPLSNWNDISERRTVQELRAKYFANHEAKWIFPKGGYSLPQPKGDVNGKS